MAFSTSTVARWTILSSSAVTPSGLCRPSAHHLRGGQVARDDLRVEHRPKAAHRRLAIGCSNQ
jgi:hypothetical protein